MWLVREAVLDDAEGIGAAHAEAWRAGYAGLFTPATLAAAVDVRRRMWVRLIGGPALPGTVLVSVAEGEVAGFIHFGPAPTNDRVGEVYGFYVHPRAWGKGSAHALMAHAIASMGESFAVAVLWTHVGAGRARRFYAKTGWTETGRQRRETLWDGPVIPAVEYERVLLSAEGLT